MAQFDTGVFSAEAASGPSGQEIKLVFRTNQFDRTPREILLRTRQQLPDYTQTLVAYEFVPGALVWQARRRQDGEIDRSLQWRNPLIRLVAAPGISVLVKGFSEGVLTGSPDLEVYRVQDPDVIPPRATSLNPDSFIWSNEINPPQVEIQESRGWGRKAYPNNYLRIAQLPSGTIISHPHTATTLIVGVNTHTMGEDARDAQQRYCFEVDPSGVFGDEGRPLVKLLKTPKVTATVQSPTDEFVSFFQVFEVDDINAVPPQGSAIDVTQPGLRAAQVDHIRPLSEDLMLSAIDLVVSSIPIAGQLIDLAEWVYAVEAKRDRWGRSVNTEGLVYMGTGALLPYVGSMTKLGAKLTTTFGRHAGTAEHLIAAFKAANLSSEEADLVRSMEKLTLATKLPTEEMRARFHKILQRIEGQYVRPEVILNAKGDGFVHAYLQDAYRTYCRKQAREGKRVLTADVWASKEATDTARQILTGLLGPTSVPSRTPRYYNIADIERPAEYTDSQLKKHLTTALNQPDRLFERLGNLIKERSSDSEVTRLLARSRVSSGQFRVLKGNLAEIFSSDLQLQIFRTCRMKEPEARLYSGVRMRLMSEKKQLGKKEQLGKGLEFSDNIIAVRRGGDLEVLAVFEVKAGYLGGMEATSQIFDWIEGRIADGSQLLLVPPWARIIDVKTGKREKVLESLTFTYKPQGTGPTVLSLQTAERHIITARGSSALGVNSSGKVAASVRRHELDMSSAELDYLAGRILGMQTWPGGK